MCVSHSFFMWSDLTQASSGPPWAWGNPNPQECLWNTPPQRKCKVPGHTMFASPYLPLFQALHICFPDRMPHFVGNFLSERMYNNSLGTIHANGSNVCCRFVDVTPAWQEKGEDGKSWIVSEYIFVLQFWLTLIIFKNRKEAKTIIEICKKYASERRGYRSKGLLFLRLWNKFWLPWNSHHSLWWATEFDWADAQEREDGVGGQVL